MVIYGPYRHSLHRHHRHQAAMAESPIDRQTPSSTDSSLVSRIQQTLNTCSQLIQAEDHQSSNEAIASLADLINQIHNTALSHPSEASMRTAMEALNLILAYISNPSLDQMILDELSFELPKSVAKLGEVSRECCAIAERVIDRFVSACSPRDMIAVLCEALDSPTDMCMQPAYFAPLLSGISKVFLCIKRRHFEQIKEAIPAILNVIKVMSSEFDDEDEDSFKDFIDRAISIATSIQEVCQKLEDRRKEQIGAVLGLFVLQIMALVSCSMVQVGLSCIQVVSRLSHFLPFCNMSYLGLITGSDVEKLTAIVLEDGDDDYSSCFSLVKHGASLAVIWGYISDEVVKAAEEDLTIVKENLRINQSKRWQTVGMLTHVLSSTTHPLQLRKHAIDFLLYIMDANLSPEGSNEDADFSAYIPSFFSAVQAIENNIVYSLDATSRKHAFAALKLVLADIPIHERFDILKASINSTDLPSMIALLLGLVKDEMFTENRQKSVQSNDKTRLDDSPFWSKDMLDLVELVLKPPTGGPPSLPEQTDAVLAALNLYRFVLITESSGKTNYTGVLSKDTLQKAYREWLLPLQTLVNGIIAENKNDSSEIAVQVTFALDLLQSVVYRCIELIEDQLKICP